MKIWKHIAGHTAYYASHQAQSGFFPQKRRQIMDFTIIGAFWALSILLSLTPDPDWACCIAAGLKGHRVMPAVAGLITGHTVMMLTVAFGAGRILAGSPALMTALTAAGAIYLLWFGVGMLRHPGRIAQGNGARADTRKSWWLRGACVSGLNPKVFLLFFALLPQFVRPSLPLSPELQMITLGAIHLATCAMIYLGVGFGAEFLLRSRASLAVLAGRVSGVVMTFVGASLIYEQASPWVRGFLA